MVTYYQELHKKSIRGQILWQKLFKLFLAARIAIWGSTEDNIIQLCKCSRCVDQKVERECPGDDYAPPTNRQMTSRIIGVFIVEIGCYRFYYW